MTLSIRRTPAAAAHLHHCGKVRVDGRFRLYSSVKSKAIAKMLFSHSRSHNTRGKRQLSDDLIENQSEIHQIVDRYYNF